jgi:hypothetical protein
MASRVEPKIKESNGGGGNLKINKNRQQARKNKPSTKLKIENQKRKRGAISAISLLQNGLSVELVRGFKYQVGNV